MRKKASPVLCLLLAAVLLAACAQSTAPQSPSAASNVSTESSPVAGSDAVSGSSTPLGGSGQDGMNWEDMDVSQLPAHLERIDLWEEGNIPATTVYTENTGGYADPPGFMPNMVVFPVAEGTEVKGAVLICAGGAFQFRGNINEGAPVAEALNALGYQCFVVNYRLRPYTQEEGALDLARAVRTVRSHAEEYDISGEDIAIIGFSAGGILCGEMALNYGGLVNGTALDAGYVPDVLDEVSANVGAVGMIYSFYGRLSVASTDVEQFAASDLPPTYFLYGSEEVFRGQIEACAEAVAEAGVPVGSRILDGLPHGFGARGDWAPGFDVWLTGVFST